jgi:hypothetical protein
MSYPYPTISSNSGLNTGSYFLDKDLSLFNISQSTDIFFGTSPQDFIEFSVFDINGEQKNWSIIQKLDTYTTISSKYVDVDQMSKSYNYPQYNSPYLISKNKNILLKTVEDLNNSGIFSGSNVISYNFIRNVGGTQDYPLIIKNISPDRKEIQLIPNFNIDSATSQSAMIYTEYLGFLQKNTTVNNILNSLLYELNNFNASNYYLSLASSNPDIVTSIKNIFGFKFDIDVIKFLNDVYTGYSVNYIDGNTVKTNTFVGIQTFIKNWLYTNYANLCTTSSLEINFQHIINKAIDNSLTFKNYNYKNLDISGSSAAFINSIFYDDFIKPVVEMVYTDYDKKYHSYLKNALNFGNNKILPILNHSFKQDSNGNFILVVKLFDFLPLDINLRDICWVSNISTIPVIQKVILSVPTTKTSYKISGPNFNINPRIKNIPVTSPTNFKSINDFSNTLKKNQVLFNKILQSLSTDYSNFSNFVLFSSAQLRVKLFVNKLNQLNSLSSSLNNINNTISTNTFLSASYQTDSNSLVSQINDIYQSFDGYESYLYNNQSLVSGSNYSSYLSGAIDYDGNNPDSLINNTPEYINSDDDYSDYLVFLSMIGHYFDNIYLYINNFPTTQYLNNSTSNSFISTIADRLLEQFGWNPISSVDNLSLNTYYVPNYSGSFSQKQKMNIIWNRILNNLPIIYKTKGTEESVRMLANIYGIPNNFLNIKEFGGNYVTPQDNSSYSFESKYYLTSYSGSNEYLSIPYNQSVQSIEFKFSIDTKKIYEQGDTVFLLKKYSNFSVYLTKTMGDYMGTLSFQLADQVLTTKPIPFFNGKIFNVLIRHQYAPSIYYNQIPSIYHLETNCIDNDDIVFGDLVDLILSPIYYDFFNLVADIEFGNVPTGNNNFYGVLDKINLWLIPLSSSIFLNHSKNFDAYDDGSPINTYTNLYYRYSVDYPFNLALNNPTYINNNHSVYNVSASAYNFSNTSLTFDTGSCSYIPYSPFPYQFKELDLLQNVTLSNLGPNKFNNNKINKVEQSALVSLSSTDLSTTPLDIKYNSNLLAAYVSPYSVRDNDMINFLGNYDIMNILGDPNYLYSSSYQELDDLRHDYNNYNLAEPVLYQEFFTLYKTYVDSSFFDSIKKLVPARSKLLVGTLVEQSILERNKLQNKPIIIEKVNENNNIQLNNAPTISSNLNGSLVHIITPTNITPQQPNPPLVTSFVLNLQTAWNDSCAISWNGKLIKKSSDNVGYTGSLNGGKWIKNDSTEVWPNNTTTIDVFALAKALNISLKSGDVLQIYIRNNSPSIVYGTMWSASITYANNDTQNIIGGNNFYRVSNVLPEWYENGQITLFADPPIDTLTNIELLPSVKTTVQNTAVKDLYANKTKYISNDEIDKRFSVLSTSGSAYVYNNVFGFQKQYIYKLDIPVYTLGISPNLLDYTYFTSFTSKFGFTTNINDIPTGSLDRNIYPMGHYSRRYTPFGSYFVTTSQNTLNSSGSLDNSSPIQMVGVNKNTSIKKLVM